MSDQWLCLIDGQKLGPLTFTRLKQLAESGRLKGDDYVRLVSDEQWLVAKNIPDLIPAPSISVDQAESSVPAPKRRHSGPLPVAQAIDDAAIAGGIPRGKVRSSGPPSGKAIAAPPAANAPFMISEARPGQSGVGLLHGRKKKRDALPLILGGAAVVGGLAIVLVLILSGVIDLSGGATTAAKADTQEAPSNIPADEFDGEEANPDDVEGEKSDAAEKAANKAPARQDNALLASVKQFSDVSKLKHVKLASAKIAVTGLWLSANEQGEPYVAARENDADNGARFLVIKLQIENAAGAAPMEYQGWGDEAALFDDADEPTQPLPPGTDKDRIVQQKIEPGGTLVDTLVFPLKSVEFATLRLVLPHDTVGIKDKKSFGLQLPRHALGRGLDKPVANASTPPVAAQVSGAGEPGDIVSKGDTPASTPKNDTARSKVDDDDFIKKLEAKARELDKMEQKK